MTAVKAWRHPEVRAWRKGDAGNVRGLVQPNDFLLTVDPGSRGIALLFEPVERWAGLPVPVGVYPLKGYGMLNRLDEVREAIADGSIETRLVVVMEESFGGGRRNIQTDLALARYTGAVLGALSALVGGHNFDVVMVRPSTWLGAISTETGRGAKRAARKAATKRWAVFAYGQEHVDASAKLAPHREAYCDALAMATWWWTVHRSVVGTTPLNKDDPFDQRGTK